MNSPVPNFLSKHKEMLFMAGRPFEPFYSMLMQARSECYAKGIFRVQRVKAPVISIGNLSMGGTGKTPHVMALCSHLISRSLRPAVITRGYGGKAGKGPLVVSNGKSLLSDAAISGDEAFMMADAMRGVIVVAGSDRYAGARLAVDMGADILILDDGFQHMALYRDINIVLLPISSPFGHVFPGGMLREPLSALKRATSILLTGCTEEDERKLGEIKGKLRAENISCPVFTSRIKSSGLRLLAPSDPASNHNQEIDMLAKGPLYAFCGIGSPESFMTTLHKENYQGRPFTIAGQMFFSDHHSYRVEDLITLMKRAENSRAKALITTAKDAVKIGPLLAEPNIIKKLSASSSPPPLLPILVLETETMPEVGFFEYMDSNLATLL